jgi:anti-sigma regulatory factor (Ser/Thr protein kinase)
MDGALEARRLARDCAEELAVWVDPARVNEFGLLVHELVTNSLRHSRAAEAGWVRVVITASAKDTRVEVIDPGPGFEPPAHKPEPSQTSGLGLFLLDRLADRWGVEGGDGTTKVWFEIDAYRRRLPFAS